MVGTCLLSGVLPYLVFWSFYFNNKNLLEVVEYDLDASYFPRIKVALYITLPKLNIVPHSVVLFQNCYSG